MLNGRMLIDISEVYVRQKYSLTSISHEHAKLPTQALRNTFEIVPPLFLPLQYLKPDVYTFSSALLSCIL